MFYSVLASSLGTHQLSWATSLTVLLIVSFFPIYQGQISWNSRHGCMIDISFAPARPPFGLRVSTPWSPDTL